MSKAIIFQTPDEIAYFRLAALKGRVKLESKGMKMRGGSTRAFLAREFGLRPRASYEVVIKECERRMQALIDKRATEVPAAADPAGTA